MKRLWFLALALAPVCSPADLDPAKTEIQFTLHDVLHTVHGTFKLKRGSIYLDPESNKVSGEIVVDVPSGVSGSEARGMKDPSNFLLKVDKTVDVDIKTTIHALN